MGTLVCMMILLGILRAENCGNTDFAAHDVTGIKNLRTRRYTMLWFRSVLLFKKKLFNITLRL